MKILLKIIFLQFPCDIYNFGFKKKDHDVLVKHYCKKISQYL